MECAGCCDGIYNCIQISKQVCGEGKLVTTYADLTRNSEFIGNKVKEALGLECGNEPLKSMGTFQPWVVDELWFMIAYFLINWLKKHVTDGIDDWLISKIMSKLLRTIKFS